MMYILEEQLNELIKNADKEEDKERFKALKVLAEYHEPYQIRACIDHYADGRYDLTIDFIGCHKRFQGKARDYDNIRKELDISSSADPGYTAMEMVEQ